MRIFLFLAAILLTISLFLLLSPKTSPFPLPLIPNQSSTTTIIATGDVMLGRSVNHQIQRRQDPNWPFQEVAGFLSSADITLINLENPLLDPCPITDTGLVFCAPTNSVSGLVSAGIDVVNTANNHALDYSQEGYLSTLRTLQDAGLKPSDENNLAIITRDQTKFGFLGFNRIKQFASQSLLSDEEITTRIKQADPQVDVLLISFHWGNEYQVKPSSAQVQLGHQAINSGADIIIGHHPHVTQPVEEYQGKPIFYSLGNFIFDQMWSTATTKGEIAVLTFQGDKLLSYRLLPTAIRDFGQAHLP